MRILKSLLLLAAVLLASPSWAQIPGGGGIVVGTPITGTCTTGNNIYNNAGVVGCQAAGAGTVTTASVVSANGFAGSVATATTTPAITITTSITGVLKGNGTAISQATNGTDYLSPGTTATITVGYTVTANNIGTVSSGTTTLSCASGNYQFLTNNGAFTLAAPTSDCGISLLVTNGASAGTITPSGFTVGASTGDALTTVNTSKFLLSVVRINSVATYIVKALQ